MIFKQKRRKNQILMKTQNFILTLYGDDDIISLIEMGGSSSD